MKNNITPEEFVAELKSKLDSLYRSDDCHHDSWGAYGVKVSPNQKFVGFYVVRMYENYGYPYDQDYNMACIHNLQTGKEKSTGMENFMNSGNGYYNDRIAIDETLSVSDDGELVYKTRDGKEHKLSL